MKKARLYLRNKWYVWVVISILGFSLSYYYGPLAKAFIEYRIFNFRLLIDQAYRILNALLAAIFLFGPTAIFQELFLKSIKNRPRYWMISTLLGSFLGYYLSRYTYWFLGASSYWFIWDFLKYRIIPFYMLPDLIYVGSLATESSLITSLIFGGISGGIFGITIGAVHYLFNLKNRRLRINWVFFVGLLFGIIGLLNSALVSFLLILKPDLNYWMPLDWDRTLNEWMLVFGSIVGLIYGFSTSSLLRKRISKTKAVSTPALESDEW